METSKEILEKTNLLIAKNNDAYKSFMKAAENLESNSLKSYLIEQAGIRKGFAEDLSIALQAYNPEFKPETDGSIAGSLHRTWIDVKTFISGNEDGSILQECVRGDKASIKEYEEFLENYSTISNDITLNVQQQLEKVRINLDRVSRLENLH